MTCTLIHGGDLVERKDFKLLPKCRWQVGRSYILCHCDKFSIVYVMIHQRRAYILVPDFIISVYGSSCNYDFFIMSLTALISLSMYSICIPNAGWDAKIDIDRESKVIRIRQKR